MCRRVVFILRIDATVLIVVLLLYLIFYFQSL